MIVLPQKFEEILNKDTINYYKGAVYSNCHKFDQIFSENRLYFFEEYTDHGIQHINSVLDACANLITSDTYKLLSEKDIAILVLSVFLHDLGMHLQPLTFKKMVTGGYDDVLNADFGDQPWAVLWENYLFEAKKFNDQQRVNLFGDAGVDVTMPDLNNPDSLTGVHRKLIGEFIRRYHPRIAFEVAFKGLTAHDGTQIDFCTEFDYKHKLLAGLLARSHGMNIRDTFPFLEKHFTKRVWRRPINVHIIYLMTLLRLGDYFQIDTSRVLKVPYLTRLFKSPVSFAEHQKHLQTTFIQKTDDDTETLFITAEPTNSTYFLALERLFSDIQKEVDNSWAVLGEVYGSKPYEEQPRLTYRRIRSNIDDKKEFEATVSYVPEQISFTVDREVPKLLVGPLYDHDPSFGVRELLQNAVDACWEREYYEKEKGNDYEGAISIKIEPLNDHYVFSITDNGKGMTLDEIRNYFLKVGGSFRRSTKWQHDHVDLDGHSNINKIGRFGIGVLAAYLLGPEIEVKTKSMFSTTGYSYKTTLDKEQIEINKEKEIKEGTIISISISDEIYKDLISDVINGNASYNHMSVKFEKWFTLKFPKVTYKRPDSIFDVVGHDECLPGLNDELSNEWHEIFVPEYKKIIWSYSNTFPGALICNGFLIPEGYGLENEHINPPTLVVYDFDAKLPVNLNRTSVYLPLSFNDILERDIYKDFTARILLADVRNPFYEGCVSIERDSIKHPILREIYSTTRIKDVIGHLSTVLYSKNGYAINHPIFTNQLSDLKYLTIFQYDSQSVDFEKKGGLDQFEAFDLDVVSYSILNPKRGIKEKQFGELSYHYLKNHNIIWWTSNLQSKLRKKTQAQIEFDLIIKEEFIQHWNFSNDVSAVYYKISKLSIETNLFVQVIHDMLGEDLIIPYAIEDRKKKFPKAFKELEPYMRKYLNDK